MSEIKTVGEGGAHAHRIAKSKIETEKDGLHKHIFFIEDRIMMTDLSGNHAHPIDLSEGTVGPESEKHFHNILVMTQEGQQKVQVSEGTPHDHELQVEMTTLSGIHQHTVELMGQQFVSLIPSDLIKEMMEAAKSVKGLEDFKISKSDYPMESNYALVKKLNEKQFKEIVRKGVESSIIKRLTGLGEGLRIESLILSKERFADVGVATRFVLDQGLDVKSSQVLMNEGLFTFQVMSREAFEETTLQRIRITEGVEAVIGFLAAKEEPLEGNSDNTVASSETGDSLTDVEQSEKELGEGKMEKDSNKKVEGSELKSLKEKFSSTMSDYGMDESSKKKKPNKARHTDDEEDKKKKPKKKEVSKSFKASYEIVSKNEEKRLIQGPVLVPDNIDLQDDIITSDEIEKAAHGYMIKLAFRDDPEFLKTLGFRNVDKAGERGFQHMDFSRKMAVVETFIAPVDMEINGRTINKGTWVMTMKVFDDEVWGMVKAGKITGFSIGGHSKSRPAKKQ